MSEPRVVPSGAFPSPLARSSCCSSQPALRSSMRRRSSNACRTMRCTAAPRPGRRTESLSIDRTTGTISSSTFRHSRWRPFRLESAQDRVVRACWFAATILLLVVLLRATVVALPEMRRSRAALIGATFVLLAKFYAHEIELGQVNILMTALVVLAVVQLRANREVGAGLLVAAAVVVKPYAVLLVPYLAARRRVGSLVGIAIGLGVGADPARPVVRIRRESPTARRVVANRHGDHRAEPDGLQQRLGGVGVRKMARARRDRSGAGDSHGGCPARRRRGGVRDARAGQRSRAARGGSAADADATYLAAGVGLRLPALDAGGDVARQLLRSAAAVRPGPCDRCPCSSSASASST